MDEFKGFLNESGINENSLNSLKKYFLFSEEDSQRIKEFLKEVKGIPKEVFEEFYNHLLSFEETRKILTKEKGIIERLKKLQKNYFEYLFSSDIDLDYVNRAFSVGKKHFENGVRLDYYQGAYLKFIDALCKFIDKNFSNEKREKIKKSILKIIFIDMDIVIKTYYHFINKKIREINEKYRTIFENSFDGIVLIDVESRKIIDLNPKMENMIGLKKEDIIGKEFTALFPEEDREYIENKFIELLEFEEDIHLYPNILIKNYQTKKNIPVEVGITLMELEDKKIILAILRDIQNRLEKEKQLERVSRLYKILYEINSLIIKATDIDTLFENVIKILVEEGRFKNAVFVELQNGDIKIIKSYKEVKFKKEELKTIISSIDKKKFLTFSDNSAISLPILLDKYVLTTTDLKYTKYALILCSPDIEYLSQEEEKLLKQIVYDVAFSIYAIKKKEEVKYLSYYDIVTDLPNRRFFLERLETALTQAKDSNQKIALILIDIDRFKNINDIYGHSIGDFLLKTIADRIKSVVRGRDLIARIGSDEFGIVAFGINDESDIIKLISRIKEVVEKPIEFENKVLYITLSIGIAIFPDDGENIKDLLSSANAAIQEIKRKGGHGYEFFNPSLKKTTLEWIELEIQLRKAIAKNHFVLYYQPIVDLEKMEIVSAEALLRWKDPEKGLIPPYKFIPILEETNMIFEIGEWVLEESIKQSKIWEKFNISISVSLNVSAKQFIKSSLSEMVKRKLVELEGKPENIIVEITESTLMENISIIKEDIEKLSKIGVRVEIDDFGTGYSSLAYLKKLPVYALKIDREFIKDLPKDTDDIFITKAIINLAHTLDRKTVAEGIETEEQLKFLIENKCDYGQGYLFSPPVPPEEFEKIFKSFKEKWKNWTS